MSKMGDEYNKRLEKYAPELLEASKRTLDTLKFLQPRGLSNFLDPCIDALEEAIAKVEGEL